MDYAEFGRTSVELLPRPVELSDLTVVNSFSKVIERQPLEVVEAPDIFTDAAGRKYVLFATGQFDEDDDEILIKEYITTENE